MNVLWFGLGFVTFPVLAALTIFLWITALIWHDERHPPEAGPSVGQLLASRTQPLPAWVDGLEDRLKVL